MGQQTARQTKKRHCSGVQGRLCTFNHREKAGNVCLVKPGPEGEDEENRLSAAGGQGKL